MLCYDQFLWTAVSVTDLSTFDFVEDANKQVFYLQVRSFTKGETEFHTIPHWLPITRTLAGIELSLVYHAYLKVTIY